MAMIKEAAIRHLNENIYHKILFTKLAAVGIPASEEVLRILSQVKGELQKQGVATNVEYVEPNLISHFCAVAAQDNTIKQAALSLI